MRNGRNREIVGLSLVDKVNFLFADFRLHVTRCMPLKSVPCSLWAGEKGEKN